METAIVSVWLRFPYNKLRNLTAVLTSRTQPVWEKARGKIDDEDFCLGSKVLCNPLQSTQLLGSVTSSLTLGPCVNQSTTIDFTALTGVIEPF